ncbi:Proline--tRNA ligase [Ephemeroptericola cinctiostellae]|uniref:Proline--tRNA ligase n=1 Tax=Ephemeroptericola cinctiostellae TaxID=2268024 RepID=A0A345D9T9_9BURK|nr:proline--tRNA ligase [Ephemeroptericola cinctiostellae]AXF85127.1 Proline--tRNA ligase [Ephemeroptericola cinctiostellae]
MKASQFFISTLKEAPAEAEIISHQLMMRAGLIKRIGSGIYTYMPMGLRSVRKVEQIIREEMNKAGAMELLMPAVQPAELWQESGRWEQYGPELLRFKDRHGRDFVVGPTHEEVITDLARRDIKSYKQLPVNWYQIQAKFRDEIRPRFGVMRGREFIMKDAYSFDKDEAGMVVSYNTMYAAYTAIFTRLGLNFRAVAADNGSIGGSGSHEFHVIAETGEDDIVYNPNSDYAANIEAAEAVSMLAERAAATQTMLKTATPRCGKCEEVAQFLNIPLISNVKSIVLAVDHENEAGELSVQVVLVLVRADHSLNEVKLSKIDGLSTTRMATEAEIATAFNTTPGYIGPVATAQKVLVVADKTVANMSDFVCGANDVGFHYVGVNWGRDLPEPDVIADVRNVVAGDPAPDGNGTVDICRGIEVGHVFQLGTKYSEAMKATFLDENGKPQPLVMGCYGIGVTRILGAAIEQNFDVRGIVWPAAIAPFQVVICPVGADKNEQVRDESQKLYETLLQAGVDVILDDRGERPGSMFADWELIGVPHRVTIGDRGLKEDGMVEYRGRRDEAATKFTPADVAAHVLTQLKA